MRDSRLMARCGGALLALILAAGVSGCAVFRGSRGSEACERQGLGYDSINERCLSRFPSAQPLTLPAWDGALNLPGSSEAQALDGLVTGQGPAYPPAVPVPPAAVMNSGGL